VAAADAEAFASRNTVETGRGHPDRVVGALTGYTVGITGHRRSEEQAEMLARRGAQVVHGPVMRTTLLHDTDTTLRATGAVLGDRPDVVVLTTGIGTRSWFAAAESAGLDADLRAACAAATVLARGPKARSAAIGAGLDVQWQAAGETSAEVLDHLRGLGARGRRVAVQRDGGAPVLAEKVRALGAEVVDVPVYRWRAPATTAPALRLIDGACAGRLDAVTFTCAYAVGNAFALAPEPDALREALNDRAVAVAVGPVCAAALRRHGVERVVEPGRARLGAMVQALVRTLGGATRVLRHGSHTRRWQGTALVHAEDGGAVTTLTPSEAGILRALLRRAPAVVAKSALVDDGVDPHAAEAAVARLRAKLGPLGEAIQTVPRRGYASTLRVESTLADG
jgi:uroporphyrinogen-III synthase